MEGRPALKSSGWLWVVVFAHVLGNVVLGSRFHRCHGCPSQKLSDSGGFWPRARVSAGSRLPKAGLNTVGPPHLHWAAAGRRPCEDTQATSPGAVWMQRRAGLVPSPREVPRSPQVSVAAEPAFGKASPQPPSSWGARPQPRLRKGENATTRVSLRVPVSSLAPPAVRPPHASASPDTTRTLLVLAQAHPEPFQVWGSAGSGPQLPPPEPLSPRLPAAWPRVAGDHVPSACEQGGRAEADVVLTAGRKVLKRREEMGVSIITQSWTRGWGPGSGCFPEELTPAAPLALGDGPQAQPCLEQLRGRNPDGQEKGVGSFGAQGSASSGGTPPGRPWRRTLSVVTVLCVG